MPTTSTGRGEPSRLIETQDELKTHDAQTGAKSKVIDRTTTDKGRRTEFLPATAYFAPANFCCFRHLTTKDDVAKFKV